MVRAPRVQYPEAAHHHINNNTTSLGEVWWVPGAMGHGEL